MMAAMRRPVRKSTAARPSSGANRLRIIGGRWRGRPLEFPDVAAVRPTADRVRETLFNWLQAHVLGARCLDLYAGSGALGIEALSRGAAHVTFVDRDSRLGAHIAATLQRLGATSAEVVVDEAQRFLRRTPQPFDIVFLDPPFGAEDLQQVLAALDRGWLAEQAWVYLERAAHDGLPALPPGWSEHRSGRAGQVGYHLLRVAR
jgi:16S rRNA (guanine966-N2)-methyltransferase